MPSRSDSSEAASSLESVRSNSEAARDIFWVRELPELNFQYVSATFASIWGVHTQRLYEAPDTWLAQVHPDDWAMLDTALQRWASCGISHFRNVPYRKVWRGGEITALKSWVEDMPNQDRAIEYRIVRPDGEIRWIHDRILSLHSSEGRIFQIDGLAEDVTQHHQTQVALKNSEDWYRMCLEYGGIGTWERGIGSNEGAWGGVTRKLLGLAEHSPVIPLAQIRAMIHPDDRPAVITTQDRLQSSGGEFDLEYRFIWPDGSMHWINNRGKFAIDANGKPRMMGIVLDVTRRRESEDAMRRSEAFFRALAENIHEVLWLSDPLFERVYYLSPNSEAVLFQDLCTLFRDPWGWQASLQAEDQIAAENFLLHQTRGRAAQMEVRSTDATGSTRWYWFQSFPFNDPDGKRLVAGVVREVTERRREAQKQLLEVEARRDALVAEVHHRIKNNLQGVIGLLRQHTANEPKIAYAIDTAAAQVHSVALVHGLMARSVHGEVSVAKLLIEVSSNVESVQSASIDVQDSVGKRLQVAEGEAVALALILNELLTNAVKHRDKTSQTRSIQVQVDAAIDGASIRIRNQGHLASTVDFTTGDGLGTGLGLVRALLPSSGMALLLSACDGTAVEATLKLTAPVISFVSGKLTGSMAASSHQSVV